MSKTVTLEVPEPILEQAQLLAKRTDRRLEDVLEDWLHRFTSDMPIELMSDEEVLAITETLMEKSEQEELQELLDAQREGHQRDKSRLDELLTHYRQGMLRKAQALQVAVSRGLRPPLSP